MIDWLLDQHGAILYLLVFLLLLGGAIGLPIPEDVPLILSGVLVQTGQAKLHIAFPVCYGAILLGDMFIFSVGRYFGPALFQKPWFKRRLPSSKIRRVRFSLEKRSLIMILVARHLFYLRTATFLTCGAVRMNTIRFLIADAVAALVSVPIMIGLGYLAAEHYKAIFETISELKWWSLLAAVPAAIGTYYFLKGRQTVQRSLESDEDKNDSTKNDRLISAEEQDRN